MAGCPGGTGPGGTRISDHLVTEAEYRGKSDLLNLALAQTWTGNRSVRTKLQEWLYCQEHHPGTCTPEDKDGFEAALDQRVDHTVGNNLYRLYATYKDTTILAHDEGGCEVGGDPILNSPVQEGKCILRTKCRITTLSGSKMCVRKWQAGPTTTVMPLPMPGGEEAKLRLLVEGSQGDMRWTP